MTGPPRDSDHTGGGEGGGSPWTHWVQIPQRQPGGQLLNCRQLHTIYMFATWKNMSWRARFGDHLFTVMFKLVLEKAEEPQIKLPTSAESSKKQESSRKTSISALLTMPKPLTVWITRNCGKFFKRWEYQTT